MTARTRTTRWLAQALTVLAAVCWTVCLAGCGGQEGPGIHPVRGQVVFQGRPAEGALVVFHPVGGSSEIEGRPRGYVQADGHFQLTTAVHHDGAPSGQNQVAVIWLRRDDEDAEPGPSLLPTRFLNPQTSGLTVEIRPGKNELTAFELGK